MVSSDAFWQHVDTSSGDGGCWPWLGKISHYGYGVAYIGRAGRKDVMAPAHRVACFLFSIGSIDAIKVDTRDTDHLCRNKKCCNPGHLELVTHAENVRRGMLGTRQKTYRLAHRERRSA